MPNVYVYAPVVIMTFFSTDQFQPTVTDNVTFRNLGLFFTEAEALKAMVRDLVEISVDSTFDGCLDCFEEDYGEFDYPNVEYLQNILDSRYNENSDFLVCLNLNQVIINTDKLVLNPVLNNRTGVKVKNLI